MKHFYDKIEGKFNFQKFYNEIVENSEDNQHFVEMGAWRGCSSVYMAVDILNSGKKIKFDVVDCFNDSSCEKFLKNIEPVKNIINLIRGYSIEVAKKYKDNSLDFVFLDGNHDYNSIRNDIEAWLPKIKKGGIISGHDYSDKSHPGVVRAVKEFFNDDYEIKEGSCWCHKTKH